MTKKIKRGKLIGKTKTNMRVYSDAGVNSHLYRDFYTSDHVDACLLHDKLSKSSIDEEQQVLSELLATSHLHFAIFNN